MYFVMIVFFYNGVESANVQKVVTIQKDSEKIQVKLKKILQINSI